MTPSRSEVCVVLTRADDNPLTPFAHRPCKGGGDAGTLSAAMEAAHKLAVKGERAFVVRAVPVEVTP